MVNKSLRVNIQKKLKTQITSVHMTGNDQIWRQRQRVSDSYFISFHIYLPSWILDFIIHFFSSKKKKKDAVVLILFSIDLN